VILKEPKMSTWIKLLKDWFDEGRCKNRTGAPLYACVGSRSVPHHIEALRPGEVVEPGLDCSGVMYADDENAQVCGRAGWVMQAPTEWLGRDVEEAARQIRLTNILCGSPYFERMAYGMLAYRVRCEMIGDSSAVPNGWFAGTRGRALQLEGYQIDVLSPDIELSSMAHFDETGDTPWQPSETVMGMHEEPRRLEGFAVQLTRGGDRFDVLYMAHVSWVGDTEWYANGEFCGTRGEDRQIEGINIVLAAKGGGLVGEGVKLQGIQEYPEGVRFTPL
jgi:hypothetical protein